MFSYGNQTYSLRPAVEDDLSQVLEIETQSFPKPWTRQAFEEEIKKPFSNFLVLSDDETDQFILGYIVFWTHFEESHILTIAVHPDWRGLHIATKLVRQAIKTALHKQVRKVFLEVRKSNSAAFAMYQSLGFFTEGIQKAFYEDGEDAYRMTLFLDQKSGF